MRDASRTFLFVSHRFFTSSLIITLSVFVLWDVEGIMNSTISSPYQILHHTPWSNDLRIVRDFNILILCSAFGYVSSSYLIPNIVNSKNPCPYTMSKFVNDIASLDSPIILFWIVSNSMVVLKIILSSNSNVIRMWRRMFGRIFVLFYGLAAILVLNLGSSNLAIISFE